MTRARALEPDTKDWTWVLERPCGECGWTPTVPFGDIAGRIRADVEVWQAALRSPGARVPPRPDVWSVTEYAAHVRDVHLLFGERVRLMLSEEDPTFANWDQDATAREERYDLQDPATVAAELAEAAAQVARQYDAVPAPSLSRTGARTNGSRFTVESLARYHLHDVVHHLWDVRSAVTLGAYDTAAAAYARATGEMTDRLQAAIDAFAGRLRVGARVLEIGSGSGRDAAALEAAGLRVRRTDVTPGFVDLLRADGHDAVLLDPLVDDLTDPEHAGSQYDGVWANACLLHVLREDLPVVLRRLAEATRPGGVLRIAVKEGDGEGWSTHGSIDLPRRFVYWREDALCAVVEEAGWEADRVDRHDGVRGERWIGLVAARRTTRSQPGTEGSNA